MFEKKAQTPGDVSIIFGKAPQPFGGTSIVFEKKDQTFGRASISIEEVRFAFLFGSFIEDSQEDSFPFHDIDVGIFLRGLEEKKSVYYALELSDRLSSLISVPVDVRVMNFAPVTFLFHVVRGQLLIDKDEDARCTFMERVVRHYLDMKPLLHRAIKEAYG